MHPVRYSGLRSERGAALVVVLGVLFALSLLSLAAVQTTENEMTIVGNKARRTQAFLAAEGGMARAQYIFRQNPLTTAADSLLDLMNADTVLGMSHFRLAMDSTLPRRRVIALGYSAEGQSGIQVLYEHGANRDNIWNNAIFTGHGNDGHTIVGPAEIHGSAHFLGGGETYVDANLNGVWDFGEPYQDANHDGAYDPPIHPDSSALDLTSAGNYLRNDYSGMIGTLASRVPALETTVYGTETVNTLSAELRVQHGRVALLGSDNVGAENSIGGVPAVKETYDAVYVTDGYSGDSPSGSVHSDNGYGSPYDLSRDPPEMPNLDDPFTDSFGNNHPTYMAYLKANALVVSDSLRIELGTSIPLMSSGFGSLSVDAAGNIDGSGIIYVEGNFTVADGPGDFYYDGRFTIVAEGDVILDEDLLSKGEFGTNDALGVVTPGSVRIGTVTNDEPELMMALFAQESVRVETRRTHVAGTIVSNHIQLDTTLESFQVPALTDNMPPGMPGTLAKPARAWRQVPRSWVEFD